MIIDFKSSSCETLTHRAMIKVMDFLNNDETVDTAEHIMNVLERCYLSGWKRHLTNWENKRKKLIISYVKLYFSSLFSLIRYSTWNSICCIWFFSFSQTCSSERYYWMLPYFILRCQKEYLYKKESAKSKNNSKEMKDLFGFVVM